MSTETTTTATETKVIPKPKKPKQLSHPKKEKKFNKPRTPYKHTIGNQLNNNMHSLNKDMRTKLTTMNAKKETVSKNLKQLLATIRTTNMRLAGVIDSEESANLCDIEKRFTKIIAQLNE